MELAGFGSSGSVAGERGYARALALLGASYNEGRGVPQNFVLAHKWYNLAASRYPASDAENRNIAVKHRDRVAAKLPPAQIAEAQRLAREWKPKNE